MKVTKGNGQIIIDFTEESTMDQIISAIKDYEEACRRSAEAGRSLGYIGTAALDDIRADTADKILTIINAIRH